MTMAVRKIKNTEVLIMYLAELSIEGQNAFLNLAVALIKADGKVSQEEICALNMYKAELVNMKDISEYNSEIIENDINFIAQLDLVMRKKVYFELVSLAFSDSDYSDKEKNLINNIILKWNLDPSICKEIDKIALEITNSLGKLGELINER